MPVLGAACVLTPGSPRPAPFPLSGLRLTENLSPACGLPGAQLRDGPSVRLDVGFLAESARQSAQTVEGHSVSLGGLTLPSSSSRDLLCLCLCSALSPTVSLFLFSLFLLFLLPLASSPPLSSSSLHVESKELRGQDRTGQDTTGIVWVLG